MPHDMVSDTKKCRSISSDFPERRNFESVSGKLYFLLLEIMFSLARPGKMMYKYL